MNIITLDFETYFESGKDGYGLDAMTTEAYVRDPRFEAHGCTVMSQDADWNEGWLPRNQIKPYFDALVHEVPDVAFLAHHAHFDGLILSHHYDIRPRFWFCTLSMGRLVLGNHLSKSLANLAQHFGLGVKNIPYHWFEGRHWDEITSDVQQIIMDNNDGALTWQLFCHLAQGFPQEEFMLIDQTIRMFTEPKLIGNTQLLGQIWQEEAQETAALLAELQVDAKTLTKNEIFADLLRAEGVEPGMKRGKDTPDGAEKWIYAFAKTDDFMRDLLDDEDERVALLAQARLNEKSNITQSRSERLGWMSVRGPMCVYLNYCGAHTTRWSGGDSVNWQNRKRGGKLEKALCAPPGDLVVIRDASQIECRILNMVAGQYDVIERFARREDPYTAIASAAYGFPVTKAHEKERGTGKQLELSCGYGCGDVTIQTTAKKGTYGPPVYIDLEKAKEWKDLYRSTHPAVTAYWRQSEDILKKMHAGMELQWGPLYIKEKRIYLPNGAPLIYETLEWHTAEDGDQFWRLRTRKGWVKLYGAKLVENVIQALARLHTSQAWLRCAQAGIRIVSMEHDKLIACVSAHEAEAASEYMRVEMSRPPEWLPGIPLDSDGFISDTFAKPEKTA